MPTLRPCQAKNPATCPYHRGIYNTLSFDDLAKGIKEQEKLIVSLDNAKDIKKARFQKAFLRTLLDCLPEVRQVYFDRLTEHNTGETAADLRERIAIGDLVNELRKTSGTILNRQRAEVESKKLYSKSTKLLNAHQAAEEEYYRLDKEGAAIARGLLSKPAAKHCVEQSYIAVQEELRSYLTGLQEEIKKVNPSQKFTPRTPSLVLEQNRRTPQYR
jgi:hypothetical protein